MVVERLKTIQTQDVELVGSDKKMSQNSGAQSGAVR